ncbi:cytidylyltransferase domain-containing protein [Dokdonia ponticola]|uniref:Cytidylyltransferase domain-containing protein n=1 Tax=Dokdonia ponticola TaxID=2041041 RepID=A0ABV9I3H2_9FLAO
MKNSILEYRFFIQARTNSSRLPNKILLPFYEGKGILEIIIEKLKLKFNSIPIVVCTSDTKGDDATIELCKKLNVDFFRGSELNVLDRFAEALEVYPAKKIIRICADNPYLDINFMKYLIDFSEDCGAVDYCSFCDKDGTPVIKTHWGLFGEIVNSKTLIEINTIVEDIIFKEHVTNYLYTKNNYNVQLKRIPEKILHRSDIRFTIDDDKDFEIMREIYPYYLKDNQDIFSAISYVDETPRLKNLMIENIEKYSK